jgi:hypothetical protein
MNQLTETAATIGLAIVGVAILALIVSRKSNTAGVISALGASFSNALGVATSPVTGAPVSGLTGIGSFGTFSGGLNGQIGY